MTDKIVYYFLTKYVNVLYAVWDHPFKTSAFFKGGGVKKWPNLTTDSSKKLPKGEGRGKKS